MGRSSFTVTVPLVALPPSFFTFSTKFPVRPRTNVGGLALFVTFRFGGPTVLTVTEPDAGFGVPPPLAVAMFVSDAAALNATSVRTVIAG